MKISVIFTVIIWGCQTQDQNVSYQLTDQNIPTTHIPTTILDDLRCSINYTTCSRLAQSYGNTSAFQVVCFEQRSNKSQLIVYLPCNSICDGYADRSTEDQERCTNHCGGMYQYFIFLCYTIKVSVNCLIEPCLWAASPYQTFWM